MPAGRFLLEVVALAALSSPGVPDIPVNDFERLHAMIKPQPGESPWREIAWLTSIREARERAVIENKPLVVYTAADGNPLGRA